jgi:hypothetical protein
MSLADDLADQECDGFAGGFAEAGKLLVGDELLCAHHAQLAES